MMHEKIVSLGSRLHYPITVTKLLKSPGDAVKKQENILEYKFSWRRKVGDDTWTDETTYTEFDSPAEGKLKDWRISEGMVISADMPCMTVEEACGHEVQIQGLCSLCGADMTEINWASEERDTDRAMINMTHDQTGLMVSESVAKKTEHDTQKRLLRQRKLSLVVDLDQTIIHACIEPTVGEWQRDPTNPNHAAVKGVKSFQLNDDGPRGLASGCTYYIKLRPGLEQFLHEVSKMYELHVYTMGTRAYALNIARIVDPERKLFGNRVISRDENGSITSKSLQRLFPVSTNMVVIIDDRADVWPRNRPNLIKVVPYDFFKGIGDINSSFLSKRTDVVPSAQQPNGVPAAFDTTSSAVTVQGEEAKASPLSEIARIAGVDDPATLKLQAEEQEKTLEKQLTDRPLLHMQEELDKKDELSSQGPDADQSSSPNPPRQHLLSDDDEELMALQDHLKDLHSSFYDMYDRRRADRREAEPTHPPGSAKGRRRSIVDDGVDLSMVPDVGDILYKLKSNVLSGLVIVLSGLVPLGVKVEESEIGMQAQSFGAQVLDTLSKRVTHLVVSTSRPRTKKVQQAVSLPSIKIVNHSWLIDCLSQWRRLDEGPYFLDVLDPNREQDRPDDAAEGASETETGGGGGDGDEAKDFRDFDWATADKDLEEFLGDDDDDNDEEDDDEEKEGEYGNGASEEHDDGTTDAGSVTGEAAEEARANTQSGSSRSSRSSSRSGIGSSGKNSSNSNGQRNGDKRKKRADETDEDGTPKAADDSVTAKKQRLSRGRGLSVLRSVYTTSNDDGGSGGSGSSSSSSSSSDGSEAVFTPNSPREVQESTRLAGDDAGADSDIDDEALERELLAELEAAGD